MENLPSKKRGFGMNVFWAGVFLVALAGMAASAAGLFSPSRPLPGSTPVSYGAGGASDAGEGNGLQQVLAEIGDGRSAQAAASSTPSASPLPVRLKIPSLGVDAGVQYVGLTKNGDMDTPKSAAAVAWYKLGAVPGRAGNAVMAGHINTRYSAHGVFEHLHDLQAGDKVEVVTAAGKTLTFRVTGKEYLERDAGAAAVFGPADGAHLNLITCAGDWDAGQRSYDKRLVVYTVLES